MRQRAMALLCHESYFTLVAYLASPRPRTYTPRHILVTDKTDCSTSVSVLTAIANNHPPPLSLNGRHTWTTMIWSSLI